MKQKETKPTPFSLMKLCKTQGEVKEPDCVETTGEKISVVSSSKNNHARRAFQDKWFKEFKWLYYEEVAFRNVCKKYPGAADSNSRLL
jgi:hypothetical protein